MTSAMSRGGRLWHLDWLRAGAMLLGIPYHAGLIYTPGLGWFVASPEGSNLIAAVTGLLGSMRMGLFFWIAGLLTAIVLARRAPWRWLLGRLRRLGVPLITATLLLCPVVMAANAYRKARDEGASIGSVWLDLLSQPGPHWVGHLWFLQTLLVFSLLAVLLRRPIGRVSERMAQMAAARGGVDLRVVLFVAALIGVWRLGVNGGWHLVSTQLAPHPTLSMIKIEPMLDYAPFFLLGMAMPDIPVPRLARDPAAWLILVAAALVFVAVWREPDLAHKIARYGAGGMLGVLGGAMILSLASALVSRRTPAIDALVAASFTLYLLHYPIVVWVGTLLQTVALPPLFEYALCIGAALAGSLLLHRAISASPTALLLMNGTASGAHRPHSLPAHTRPQA